MAERRSMLSEENQPTVVAVCFVLALLATGFGVYDLLQIRALSAVVQHVNNVNVESTNSQLTAATTRLADLEKRLAEVEQRAAAAPMPVAQDGGAPPVPAGKPGKSKTP